MRNKKNSSGFLIVEVLLSIVIFSVLFLTIFSTISFLERRTARSRYDSQASGFVEEGMEIAHNALISDWGKYGDGEYSPAYNASTKAYTLIPGQENDLAAKFTRVITLMSVCRNQTDGEIVSYSQSGVCQTGKKDIYTREVITKISWSEPSGDKNITAKLLVLNQSLP